MNNIQIRSYTDQDYQGVVDVLKSAHLYSDWDSRDVLKRRVARNPDSHLIALDGEKVVGNIYIILDDWTAQIYRLAVSEEYRRQGIGERLLTAAEEIIKANGIRNILLFADFNDKALVEWYNKRGYSIARHQYGCFYKEFLED